MTSGEFFLWFFVDVYPCMNVDPLPRSVVIMDNHKAHKWDVFQLVAQFLGVIIFYLPSYSPDFNAPAEEFFRSLKQNLRAQRAIYSMQPKTTICNTVVAMKNFNILPIMDRVGYTWFCNP